MGVVSTFLIIIKLLLLSGCFGNAMENSVVTSVTKMMAVSAQKRMEQAVTQLATRLKSTASDNACKFCLHNSTDDNNADELIVLVPGWSS